jgi:DNA-binding beta-propeller fold protein YncE
MEIKNFNFTKTAITAQVRDGNFIWFAFLGSSGTVRLRKTSYSDAKQMYFELTPSVDKIVRMKITGTKLYAAVQDTTNIALYYSTSNPVTTTASVPIPAGINEFPIDIAVDTDYFYILTPGTASGENAKILKYSTASTPVLQTTIDLTTVNNARSIEIDDSDNLWVVTYESPANLVKVTKISGDLYSDVSYPMNEVL